jgi:hypothetical protein
MIVTRPAPATMHAPTAMHDGHDGTTARRRVVCDLLTVGGRAPAGSPAGVTDRAGSGNTSTQDELIVLVFQDPARSVPREARRARLPAADYPAASAISAPLQPLRGPKGLAAAINVVASND